MAYNADQFNIDPNQMNGVLGLPGAAPQGVLGGGGGSGWQQFWNSDAVLPAAAALIAGPTLKQGLAGAFAQAGPGVAASRKRMLWNSWLKAGAKPDPNDPTFAALMSGDTDFAEKMALTQAARSPTDSLTAEMKNFKLGQSNPDFKAYDSGLHPRVDPNSATNAGVWTLVARRQTKPYMDMPAYKLMAGAGPLLSKIKLVGELPSGSIGDAELLDAVSLLNTGGNGRVTEAQVQIPIQGRSFWDQMNVWKNYAAGHGGQLSDDQRAELQKVAQRTYDAYKKYYQPIYDAGKKSMTDAHVPEEYQGVLPDLNSIGGLAGFSDTGDPSAVNAGAAPAPGGARPRAYNPQTHETVEWDGMQ